MPESPQQPAALPAWSEVRDQFVEAFPGLDPQYMERRYTHAHRLSQERERLAGAQEQPWAWLARRAIPFGSAAANAARNISYGRARQRVEAGTPEEEDYSLIAAHERLQELDRSAGIGGQVASGLAQIPAVVGEFGIGGRLLRGAGAIGEQAVPLLSRATVGRAAAQAATAPSLWLAQGAERNTAAGRDPTDLRGMGAAYGLGAMQAAVFGRLGQGAQSLPARVAAGMAEQQVIDLTQGALTQSSDLPTGYGVLGDLLQGHNGEALQHATVQAVTFAAFSLLHRPEPRPGTAIAAGSPERAVGAAEPPGAAPPPAEGSLGAPDVVRLYGEALDGLRRRGASAEQAGRVMREVFERVRRAAGEDPEMSRQDVLGGMEGVTNPAVRRFVERWAESFPDRPEGRQGEQAGLLAEPPNREVAMPAAPPVQGIAPPAAPPSLPAPETARLAAPPGPQEAAPGPTGPPVAPQAPEAAPAAVAPPPHAPAARFHIVNYKEPGRSVDVALDMLERRGTAPRPLETWTDAENARSQAARGTATLGFDPGGWSGEIASRTGIDNLRGSRFPLPYEPGLREVVYHGEETTPNYQRLREAVDKINGERADASLMQEYGHAGPLPPVELVARGGRKVAARAPEQPRSFSGPEESAAAADLNPLERVALAVSMRGDTYEAAANAMGVTKQAAFAAGKKALDKLKAIDPENWGRYKTLAEVKRAALDQQQLEGGGARVLPGLGGEGPSALDSAIDPHTPDADMPEAALAASEQVRRLVAAAESARMDPYEFVRDNLPGLEAKIGKAMFREVVDASREFEDAVTSDAARLGVEPSSLRRAVHERLREGAAPPEADAPGAGVPGPEGAQALQGPGQVPDAAPPPEPPPAPAAAPGGPAGGDQLSGDALSRELDRAVARIRADAAAKGKELIKPGHPDWEDARESDIDPAYRDPDAVRALGREMAASGEIDGSPTEAERSLLKQFIQDEGGYLDPEKIREWAAGKLKAIRTGLGDLANGWRKMSGQIAPAVHAFARRAGEALARYISAPVWAKWASLDYINRVLGTADLETRRLWGAALHEFRFRHARSEFAREANAAHQEAMTWQAQGITAKANKAFARSVELSRRAREVTSVFGMADSPIKDEAAYQKAIADKGFQDMLAKWRGELAPELDRMYRQAQGLDPADPIDTLSQIPGAAFNAMPLREEGLPTGGASSAGNLRNVRLRKDPFAREAKLNAKGYEFDLAEVISNSFSRRAETARKAEFIRELVDTKGAQWGKAGERPEVNGQEAKALDIPYMNAPKGTQAEGSNTGTLWVDPRLYAEVRDALNVDRPAHYPVLTTFLKGLGRVALVSTVEAVYHGKNLLTFAFKPGFSLIELAKNGYRAMKGDPEVTRRLAELADIGALKPEGTDTGVLWGGRLDPTAWMSRVLDFLDHTMRLTADDAFARLRRQGRVEGSEQNRRDFINQLGQYNRRAQAGVVRWLRDSGVGPFATAASNYLVQGLKAVTGSPGVAASSPAHALGLRAEYLARMAVLVAGVPLLNYLWWGRSDGDANTPWGALRTGNDGARTRYWAVADLTGATRGLRSVGALAMIEGARPEAGARVGQRIDRAADDVWHSLAHIGLGPGVQTVYTALTGRGGTGVPVADRAAPGDSQLAQNVRAAALTANPLVGTATGAARTEAERRRQEPVNWWELAGPLGARYRRTPPGRPRPGR